MAMDFEFTIKVSKEGSSCVAHAVELDISAHGETEADAVENLRQAVRLYLEEAARTGTLDKVLSEAGYVKQGPQFVRFLRTAHPGWSSSN